MLRRLMTRTVDRNSTLWLFASSTLASGKRIIILNGRRTAYSFPFSLSLRLALGWNYFAQWAVVLPLEIVAAAITVEYWTDSVPVAAWVTSKYQPTHCCMAIQS